MYQSKQMIVVRRDLKMRKGKIAAQAGHACVTAVLMALEHENRLSQVRTVGDGIRLFSSGTSASRKSRPDYGKFTFILKLKSSHSGRSGRNGCFCLCMMYFYDSRTRPSVEIVTTCHGMNLPLFFKAVTAARSIPPQHGTSIRTMVRLLMSLFLIISVSFSL